MHEQDDLHAELRAIASSIVDLTNGRDVLREREFRRVFLRAKEHWPAASGLLRSGQLGQLEAGVLVLAMQGLHGRDYIAFLSVCLESFEAGVIDEDVLELAVFPGLEWNDTFAQSTHDPGVQGFLRLFKDRPTIPSEMRRAATLILQGHVAGVGAADAQDKGEWIPIRRIIEELERGEP